MIRGRKKIKYSMQITFFAIFFLFIAMMVGLLNTYPTISSRDAVFSSKRSLMLSQAGVMASSLSALETLDTENVGQVMELVDVNAFDRVVVTNTAGLILYDTAAAENAVGRYALFPELTRAIEGEVLFSSKYDGLAFRSRACTPVVSFGSIAGAVYLYEYDSEQAAVIKNTQAQLRSISLIVGCLALLTIFAATKTLTRRITGLVGAFRIVRGGNYEYRLAPRGRDEVAELTREFNDMASQLQSTDELRRRFVSDASHELRTPLASIRLLSDSIVQSESMDVETMREFAADIGSEAERLQRMTEKLLKLTRMDSHVPDEKSRVDMKKTTEKTLHLLTPLAQTQNITIFSELEEKCFVFASEDDIYQIIFNLTENALKYNTFGGNAFIRLGKEDGFIRLFVEDTGIGIPEEDLPHIFSRFYRVDKARRNVGGSGLGLSIVHDAVVSNGGEIAVERRETTGTRFVVSFPECGEGTEER